MNKINAQQFQNNLNPYLHQNKTNPMSFGNGPHPYVQPPMHQPVFNTPNQYSPFYQQGYTNPGYGNQGWQNDPMLGNIKSPYMNNNMMNMNTNNGNGFTTNTNNQKPQNAQNLPQNPQQTNPGSMSTSSFGGGWSKRRAWSIDNLLISILSYFIAWMMILFWSSFLNYITYDKLITYLFHTNI